jgi:hypothetical protein
MIKMHKEVTASGGGEGRAEPNSFASSPLVNVKKHNFVARVEWIKKDSHF